MGTGMRVGRGGCLGGRAGERVLSEGDEKVDYEVDNFCDTKVTSLSSYTFSKRRDISDLVNLVRDIGTCVPSRLVYPVSR